MIAARLDAALKAAGIPVLGVSIGDPANRATWRLDYAPNATAQQRTDGEALRLAFDPFSQAVLDAELDVLATREATLKDVLATCALIAKTVDPAGWNALNQAQKIARVQALAADWKTFRIFVERNL